MSKTCHLTVFTTYSTWDNYLVDYLFVVRDPLARILSAMNYERPNMNETEPFSKKFYAKELYYDCNFWTLEGK